MAIATPRPSGLGGSLRFFILRGDRQGRLGLQKDEIMRTISDVARLRQIRDELDYLFTLSDPNGFPSPFTCAVSVLIREAISLGAFAGPEWVKLRAYSKGLSATGHKWGDGIQAWSNALDILGRDSFPNDQDAYRLLLNEITAAAESSVESDAHDPGRRFLNEWSESSREQDGPVPFGFRFNGAVYQGLPSAPSAALSAAWDMPNRSLHKDKLAEALGDREDFLSDFALQNIRGQLNKFFRRHREIPYYAKVDGLYLRIIDGRPANGRKAVKKSVARQKS